MEYWENPAKKKRSHSKKYKALIMILLKNIDIDSIADLRNAVQTAIELEHSTIPPYLTANFTLSNTGNDDISNLIGSIVGEEMLHLSIACNLLNAIGGSPVLNKPGFVPTYPGPLPGSVDTGLIIPLAKFSLALVKDKFMAIEEPEDPIHIKLLAKTEADSLTIGQFYAKIKTSGPDKHHHHPQQIKSAQRRLIQRVIGPI